MKVQYVLWGLGRRGKRMINVLGIDSIEAFIDKDSKYKDQTYMGKKIISFEEYKKHYVNLILMVTPKDNEEILEILHMNGIWRYLLPEDIPFF